MIKRSEILDYVQRRYGIGPDYPFAKYPDYAVFRHPGDEKWFCLLMTIARDRLSLEGEGECNVIDVKSPPMKVDDLKTQPGYRPAYHMNKTHWLSVLLDGRVKRETLFDLIDHSFELTR
ncbi:MULTISPECIES: MmcQ/YjbR family DNA-binding protein [Asaia]|uniref:MmcQ/YjbR family DNA-binding protein n=1 Tax=Asaia TaxID=91914 RepID=UPI002FC2EA37